jgi:hypothetical protein
MIPGTERREDPRFKCLGKATIQGLPEGLRCPAKIVEMSARGCLLQVQEPTNLALEASAELTFTVKQEPFRVRAEVRSLRSPLLIGFRFIQVTTRTESRIAELIEELERTKSMWVKHSL